jgi:MFS family permease
VVGVLALAGMLASLQQTLVVPLIPDLPRILDVNATTASWAVTATILTGAVATPIVSRLADIVGKRRMILVALMTMTAGSVLIAVGGSFATVVVGRSLQGFASSLIPVGISLMRDSLPR